MEEYLSKDKLLQLIEENQPMNLTDSESEIQEEIDYRYYYDMVKNLPVEDVVPIVRCKDCVYSQLRYGHLDCINGVSYRNTWNDPDMYCKYGVRRADNDKL